MGEAGMIAGAISFLARWARNLRRYLLEVAKWLTPLPLVSIFVAALFVYAIFAFFAPCVEQQIRISGMWLQLLGVILAAIGLRDTRRAFEDQPTTWGSIKKWWIGRPKLMPRHIVMAASAAAFGISGMSARARVGSGPNASLDQRVAMLERQYESLFDEVGRMSGELNKKTNELSAGLESERMGRETGDKAIKDQLKKAVAEGLPLGRTGAIFFFFGILLASVSPEIARLVGASVCQSG